MGTIQDQLTGLSESMRRREQQDKLMHIFKPYLENFPKYNIQTDEVYDLVYEEAMVWLSKSFPDSRKLLSKKNRARLSNKRFMIHVKEKSTYIIARIINAETIKKMKAEAMIVTPMSTEKGLLYILTDLGDISQERDYLPMTAITSHVFDRYSQRCFDSELSRLDSIKSYVTDQIPGWTLKKDLTYLKPTRKGISLGEYAVIPTKNDITIVLFLEKTFLSSDMVRLDQEKEITDSVMDYINEDEADEKDNIYLP